MPKIIKAEHTPEQQLAAAIRAENQRRLIAEAAERTRLRGVEALAAWEATAAEMRVAWLAERARTQGLESSLSFANSVGFALPSEQSAKARKN